MIHIIVNGETKTWSATTTLSEILTILKVDKTSVAIARNDEVIPKIEWGQTTIQDGDRIEIIRPVGGG